MTRLSLEELEPRCCPSVDFHGGTVLQHPVVAEVFAGTFRPDLDADVRTAATTYATWFGAYGVTAGGVNAVWEAGTRNLTTQSDVAALIREGIATGHLPRPDGVSQLYMVFTPNNIGTFHSFFSSSGLPDAPYGVASLLDPPGSAGPSHEVVETATDPFLESFYSGKPQTGEVADLAKGATVQVQGRTMAAAVAPDGVTLLSGPTPLQPVQPFPRVDDLFILMVQNYTIAVESYAFGNFQLANFAYNSFLITYFWITTGHYRFFGGG